MMGCLLLLAFMSHSEIVYAEDAAAVKDDAADDGAKKDDAADDGTKKDDAADDGAKKDDAADDGAKKDDGEKKDDAADDGAKKDEAKKDEAKKEPVVVKKPYNEGLEGTMAATLLPSANLLKKRGVDIKNCLFNSLNSFNGKYGYI